MLNVTKHVGVLLLLSIVLFGCGSSGGNDIQNDPTLLVSTWTHTPTQTSSLQTLVLTGDAWQNTYAGNGGCVESGTYVATATTITFTYDANGGCNGEAQGDTLVVRYEVTATTLKLYDATTGALLVDYAGSDSNIGLPQPTASPLAGTWFHAATQNSSNQTLTLTLDTWENVDGGCMESGTYTATATTITFTYGAGGGCLGELPGSTYIVDYTVDATTLALYEQNTTNLIVDYVKQ